jgi:hypothetical protein
MIRHDSVSDEISGTDRVGFLEGRRGRSQQASDIILWRNSVDKFQHQLEYDARLGNGVNGATDGTLSR